MFILKTLFVVLVAVVLSGCNGTLPIHGGVGYQHAGPHHNAVVGLGAHPAVGYGAGYGVGYTHPYGAYQAQRPCPQNYKPNPVFINGRWMCEAVYVRRGAQVPPHAYYNPNVGYGNHFGYQPPPPYGYQPPPAYGYAGRDNWGTPCPSYTVNGRRVCQP